MQALEPILRELCCAFVDFEIVDFPLTGLGTPDRIKSTGDMDIYLYRNIGLAMKVEDSRAAVTSAETRRKVKTDRDAAATGLMSRLKSCELTEHAQRQAVQPIL